MRSGLTATSSTGLTGAPASFALAVSGTQPSPSIVSDSVSIDNSTSCANIAGFTRVFAAPTADRGSGPVAPDVYDVIPLPTPDLPGPPDDNAPEVITNCQAGSTDSVYDVNTRRGAGLEPVRQQPAGAGAHREHELEHARLHPDAEARIVRGGRRRRVDPRLDLRQRDLRAAAAERDHRQRQPGDVQLLRQRSSARPAAATGPTIFAVHLRDAVHEPQPRRPRLRRRPSPARASGGATSITVTYPGTIPVSSGVRFKFEGYGPGTSSSARRAARSPTSVRPPRAPTPGPTATIDSFTPQSTTLPTSSGGTVSIAFATTGRADAAA